MTREALVVALLGLSAAGCGSRHRPVFVADPAPVASAAPAPPQALPQEPTEGRLVAGHVAALGGIGVRPPEPFAPRGAWERTPRGVLVWVPTWLSRAADSSLRPRALLEVDETEPEADPRIPAGTRGVRSLDTRVVICDPGGFSYAVEGGGEPSAGTLLARGLTGFGLWQERQELPAGDVLWVAWRMSQYDTLPGAPSGAPTVDVGRLLPALAHELRHEHTQDRLGE